MSALWMLPSALIVVLIVLGPLGTVSGILRPEAGWGLFFAGLGIALVALPAFSGAAAIASATGRSWRGQAVRAAIVPLLVVVGLIGPRLSRLNPVIHDIATDPTLEFTPDVAALRAEPIDRARVLALQREAFPDIEPLQLPIPQQQAFEIALATARSMPTWEIVAEDAAAGRIEAVARSRIFRFADDVVIRVQQGTAGSTLDVRSRSRFGESDFGVNAERVRSYLDAVREKAGAPAVNASR
jgi:uncharacterized protein (DUF1499 family)